MKNGCIIFVVAIVGGFIGIALLGSSVRENVDAAQQDQIALLGDANSALRMKLQNPTRRELHLLTKERVLCGQVKHDASAIGFVPFAYSHALGLSVAEVWGKGQPEELNRRYGCKFRALTYSNEWTKPFWGGTPEGEIYSP